MTDMRVEVDAVHGGRWSSLVGPDGKEWLWRRDAPERAEVRPGDPFVDAGGLEECFPTIGGSPDHGDIWSRTWRPAGAGLRVSCDDFELTRTITVEGAGLTAAYGLRAEPDRPFIWAAHALLDLSGSARVDLPAGRPMTVDLPDRSEQAWWPMQGGVDVSRLGPSDGSVMGVRVPGVTTVTVVDGPSRLTFELRVDGQPFGVMLWRNLGGWPEGSPYRSTGVEPMIGHRTTLANAGPGEFGVVPSSGELSWSMHLRAT